MSVESVESVVCVVSDHRTLFLSNVHASTLALICVLILVLFRVLIIIFGKVLDRVLVLFFFHIFFLFRPLFLSNSLASSFSPIITVL